MRAIMEWLGRNLSWFSGWRVLISRTSRSVAFGLAKRKPSSSSTAITLAILRYEESGTGESRTQYVPAGAYTTPLGDVVCFSIGWTKTSTEKLSPNGPNQASSQ